MGASVFLGLIGGFWITMEIGQLIKEPRTLLVGLTFLSMLIVPRRKSGDAF